MNKIRLILEGYFQCTPDHFEKVMKTIEIESAELEYLLANGYTVIGNDNPGAHKYIYEQEAE